MSLGDVEILARSPIFAPLDHEDLEVLAGIAHRRHYEKGQVIFFANEHPEGLHPLNVNSGDVARTQKGELPSIFAGMVASSF